MQTRSWDEQKISEPGIVAGVPIERYHSDICAGPSISSSGLRLLDAKTPAHYWATSYLNPAAVKDEPTKSLALGSAAHHLLLGESSFGARFALRPEEVDGEKWQGNRKACRAWMAEQEAAGKTVLTSSDLDIVKGMAASLARHPLIKAGILQGLVEHSLFWKDEKTGVWLKARPDVIPTADGVVVDLKTTVDAAPHRVPRDVVDYGYHMQGAMVGAGMKAAAGVQMEQFVLVLVEKEPPFAVSVCPIDDEMLYWGRRQLRRAINKFAACLESGIWPGYPDETPVRAPEWWAKRMEFEDQHGLLPAEERAA